MIPYDDLVAALANWRAKQGLPVVVPARISTPVMATPSYAAPAPAPAARAPGPVSRPMAAAPAPAPQELDVDESALLEEAPYEDSGAFEGAFGRLTDAGDNESTAIGAAPAPRGVDTADTTLDENADLPPPPRGGGRRGKW